MMYLIMVGFLKVGVMNEQLDASSLLLTKIDGCFDFGVLGF